MAQQRLENLHGGYQAMRLVVINLLLDFIRDENTSQVSHQCFNVAQRQLLGLMKSLSGRSISFCSLVVEIIQICVDRIRNGTELIQSMALIRKASAYFTNNTYLDQDRFVSELLVGHKLIELTINAFKAYKFAAKVHFESKSVPLESPRNRQAQVDPNKIVTGKNMFATHGEYLTYFRDFLSLLFDLNWQIFSQFPIPVKMVGKLWQCAMKYSLGEVERDDDVQWLTTQCKKTSFCHYYERRRRYNRYQEDYNLTLQIETMKYLLDCFGRLDPTAVTAPQFGCFKDCFIFGSSFFLSFLFLLFFSSTVVPPCSLLVLSLFSFCTLSLIPFSHLFNRSESKIEEVEKESTQLNGDRCGAGGISNPLGNCLTWNK